MTIQGKIIDSETGSPIPAASVTVVDSSGRPVGVGTSAGKDGVFYLSSPNIFESSLVQISSIGYQPVQAAVTYFISGNTIDLEPMPEQLRPVVVRPSKPLWWALAVVGGLLLISKLEK